MVQLIHPHRQCWYKFSSFIRWTTSFVAPSGASSKPSKFCTNSGKNLIQQTCILDSFISVQESPILFIAFQNSFRVGPLSLLFADGLTDYSSHAPRPCRDLGVDLADRQCHCVIAQKVCQLHMKVRIQHMKDGLRGGDLQCTKVDVHLYSVTFYAEISRWLPLDRPTQ